MLSQLQKWKIKAIIWDFDGVLVDINHAYYNFITHHSKFKKYFKNLKFEDLNKALPIDQSYGAVELSTNKNLGRELDKVFCESRKYYSNRHFYPDTEKVLKFLDNQGYKQFVLSAGFNETKKLNLIRKTLTNLDFIKIYTVQHIQQKDNKNVKKNAILQLLQKQNLKPQEVVLIDDRIYNIYSALNAGIHAIRFRSEFTTPNPKNLQNIPEVWDIREFLQ